MTKRERPQIKKAKKRKLLIASVKTIAQLLTEVEPEDRWRVESAAC